MYGIFTNIYPINDPNVGKYTIHGSYGIHIIQCEAPATIAKLVNITPITMIYGTQIAGGLTLYGLGMVSHDSEEIKIATTEQ